jgi:hypothetical protein
MRIYDWAKEKDFSRWNFPLIIGDTIYYNEREKEEDEKAECLYVAETKENY